MSLEGAKKTRPFNHCFAGVDKDAVDAARQHMFPFSIIAKYGFVQKRRISTHARASPH
jgi:hypothetical protein